MEHEFTIPARVVEVTEPPQEIDPDTGELLPPAPAATDDGDDLARADLQVDAVERAHRTEGAAYARQARCAAPLNVSRLLRRSLELRRHRSLRGHYPTGSKGQRRLSGRYLSRPPPAPLCV